MRRLRRNPLAMGSIIVLVIIILTIMIAPHIVPYSYSQIITVNGVRDKSATNLGPFEWSNLEQKYMDQTGESLFPHILGTDSLGRDYFIRVIYGTRVSLSVGVVASIMVLLIGVIYGSIAGYFGGMVDMIMMRIVDIIYSLPDMLLIILLSVVLDSILSTALYGTALSSLGTNMISMFVVFALLYWVSMARIVRGQILSIKNNEYVLAARCIGTKNGRILKRHILPNCLSVIIITTALQIPSAIFTESYLSFLGLGVAAPLSSLGSLANDARSGMQSYPLRLVVPALVICLIVLALNLLGDGLRDAFDSKLK
jgi:oligopeptide transport system permease protein